MIEIILSLLAACITICFASLLVKKQNEDHEITKELNEEIQNSLKDIVDEVSLLTKEEPIECTLTYLEKRVEALNKCLNLVSKPKDRRIKNVKRKKNFADD